jgi:hypothetical protein
MRPRGSPLLFAWIGIGLPPIVWATCFQWSYALTGGICLAGESPWRIHVLFSIATLASLMGWLSAYRAWNSVGRGVPADEADRQERDRFLGVFGMLFCSLIILLIAAQWAPVFFIDPCVR